MLDRPPTDPADHAEDFSRRYAGWADYIVSQRMLDLGIDPGKIGTSDPRHGIQHAAFHPDYRTGGGVSPDGRITIDSGIFNPALMDSFGPEVSEVWIAARFRDRLDASLAHEYEESAIGSHERAVDCAPDTKLPISDNARHLLRIIAGAEKRRR